MDYGSNIAHKINLKLGGINQTISADRLGKFGDGRAMLVGMDVTHPSPGSLPKSPSVVGVVANTDPSFGQWPGSVRIQSHREMITNLKEMFNERLEAWLRRNNNLPERILIYRDGVSETQLQDVLEEELSQIEVACEIRYKTKTTGVYPKISMFVCGKRHHTRFYPTQNQDGDGTRGQNCRNGTVVDRGVSSEHLWEFFLQAHHAIQGTAKPTRYIVIRDDNQLDANTVESFVCLHPHLKLLFCPLTYRCEHRHTICATYLDAPPKPYPCVRQLTLPIYFVREAGCTSTKYTMPRNLTMPPPLWMRRETLMRIAWTGLEAYTRTSRTACSTSERSSQSFYHVGATAYISRPGSWFRTQSSISSVWRQSVITLHLIRLNFGLSAMTTDRVYSWIPHHNSCFGNQVAREMTQNCGGDRFGRRSWR